MDLAQIIGFAAGFGTTFAALPDLIAMLNRRSSVSMNPRMAAITGTFQILWVIYGALIGSRNIIMWNVIAVLTNYLPLAHTFTFVARTRGHNHAGERRFAGGSPDRGKSARPGARRR